MSRNIEASRYNSMQSRIRSILGNGSGQFGYGQILQSSQVKNVPPIDIVTSQQMQQLKTDINTAKVHQSNINTTVPNIATTNTITEAQYALYETEVDSVYNSRSSVHPERVTVESKLTSVRSAPWGGVGLTNIPPCTAVSVTQTTNGVYDYTINFGPNTGTCGIAINTGPIPDRFTLVWNGQTYTTGFHGIGSNVRSGSTLTENQRLAALGFPPVQTTATSSNLTFNKTSSSPSTASLRVEKPIGGSYTFTVICPTNPPVTIGSSIQHEFEVTFPGGYTTTSNAGSLVTATGADHRRHFFNAGGEIRITPTITGGTGSKYNDWRTMITNLGTVKFNSTTATPTGSGTSFNIGNFNLTDTYQTIFEKYGSGVYSENFIRIQARGAQNSNIVRFLVIFNDADTGGFDETVTGTITNTVSQLRPTGSYVSLPTPTYRTIKNLSE